MLISINLIENVFEEILCYVRLLLNKVWDKFSSKKKEIR